jgi:hypothetical protein
MIRHVPGAGSRPRRTLELIDIKRNYGNFTLGYRFPYAADVDLVGSGDLNLSGERDPKKAASGGWEEVLDLAPGGLTSTHPLSPEASARLERALLPLIRGFRASAGRFAVVFWAHLESRDQRARFSPVLGLKTSWGPGRRGVEVYLKRHTDAVTVEWRQSLDNKLSSWVDPDIAESSPELGRLLAAVAVDPGILREVADMFAIAKQANAGLVARGAGPGIAPAL